MAIKNFYDDFTTLVYCGSSKSFFYSNYENEFFSMAKTDERKYASFFRFFVLEKLELMF